ncbi:MAG: hypothetical protein NDJ92_21135 [Thermoanaerobaculia bacterium]|nr:hypothetical protein [Thermoanaerobaculia bacterium]
MNWTKSKSALALRGGAIRGAAPSSVIVAIAAAAAVGAHRSVGATRWVARLVRHSERATHRVAPPSLTTNTRHQAAVGGAQAGVPAPQRSARAISQL